MVLDLLHKGIKRVIEDKNWKGLSDIQMKAIPVILAGDDCVIEAPTAGGKTEAFFFPTISRAANNKKNGVQVLYIAPLKALLNNVELRALEYAKACGIHAFKWHGDVSQIKKIEETKDPSQLLLTTPESLEAILLRKSNWSEMFRYLESVIIDEAHNFAQGDRGGHLISVLERLEYPLEKKPQRIAATATIGNPSMMLKWLAGTTRKPGKRIHVVSNKKQEKDFSLSFFNPNNDIEDDPQTCASYRSFVSLYEMLPLSRSIIFAPSRSRTESLASAITEINKTVPEVQRVKVRTHHSNVSKFFREEAEGLIKIKSEEGLNAIISTSTLELGIDIGELDKVIQIDSLSSPSSFLQRVGRTGRRPGKPQFFSGVCCNEEVLPILTAVINLGLRSVSEDIAFPSKAYHLMAHQLLCLSLQNFGIDQNKAWNILSRPHCFSEISKESFLQLVEHMISKDFLRVVEGQLVSGDEAEKYFLRGNWRNLFAVFESGPLYDVFEGKKHIGSLDSSFAGGLEIPFFFVLGGVKWMATKVNHEQQKIAVKKAMEGNAPKWMSFGGPVIPYVTAKEVGKILCGTAELSFLNEEGNYAINFLRAQHADLKWEENKWILQKLSQNKAILYNFCGEKINRALSCLMEHGRDKEIVTSIDYSSVEITFSKEFKLEKYFKELNTLMSAIGSRDIGIEKILIDSIRSLRFSKFCKMLPDNLAKLAQVEQSFDIEKLILECNKVKLTLLNNE